MATWLVSFDLPGIHRYVFGADKARLVRGASGLIDHVNREVVPAAFAGALGRDPGDITVYAHGGNGLLVVDGVDRDALAAATARARGEVSRRTGDAIRLSVGVSELDGSFPAALREAIRDRMRDRYAPPPPVEESSWGDRPRCELCGDEPGDGKGPLQVSERETWEHVGAGCRAREQAWIGQRRGLVASPWRKVVSRVVGEAGDGEALENLRPADFQSIGESCAARAGYVGVVYADGDGMGNIVRRIDERDVYAAFAEAVDGAIVAAAADAVGSHFGRELRAGSKPGIDLLLVGGDDVVAVVRADRALPFALDLARAFRERVREGFEASPQLWGGKIDASTIGLSVGVAIARADQPFRGVVARAEELLREAKKKREPGRPAVDFEDVSQGHGVPLEDLRATLRRTATGRAILHGTRPLFLDEAEKLLDAVRGLARAGDAGKTRANNVFQLGLAGPVAGSFELKRMLGREAEGSGGRPVRDFLEALGVLEEPVGWKETARGGEKAWESPLADAAQLFPYVGGTEVTR